MGVGHTAPVQLDPVVIVSGARTPIGSYGGVFRDTDAHVLGATAVQAALARAEMRADAVDELIFGCVGQVGPDAYNARRVAIQAGLASRSTALNVNRLCASGLEAIWWAALTLGSHQADVVVAGGNENMSRQPFLDYAARDGYRLGPRTMVDGTLSLVTDPWGKYPMGVTAEAVARRWGISRQEQDLFALGSQQKARQAIADGVLEDQIVPVEVQRRRATEVVTADEHPRPETTLDRLAALSAAFAEGGTVTAGNSSGINDGACALVLMREEDARARGARILGRIEGYATAGVEPEIMGYAPVYAIKKLLERHGLHPDDLGVVELNEAFAAQAVAVIRDAGLDPAKVNPTGGAIAFGHPVGATGAILVLKCLYEMRRAHAEWSMVTMCVGGGQGVAALLRAVIA